MSGSGTLRRRHDRDVRRRKRAQLERLVAEKVPPKQRRAAMDLLGAFVSNAQFMRAVQTQRKREAAQAKAEKPVG